MFSVAIDGPAGAGKSSVARAVSKELGIYYFDSGSLYRALGYFLLKNKVNLSNNFVLEQEIKNCNIEVVYIDFNQQIFVNGERVDGLIRSSEISLVASFVSKHFFVRNYLLEIQREFAKKNSVVMDGRDIGTVVLKEADLKIFLTATLEVRAKRRFNEFLERGMNFKFEEVLKEIESRDFNDRTREIAPLKMARDAVLIDNSDVSFEQSVGMVVSLIKKNVLEEQVELT